MADWENIDYTGLPHAGVPGAQIVANVYNWADTMPDYASSAYVPGKSWYSQYAAFINALKAASPDARLVDAARDKLAQETMTDGAGGSWPGYRISPGLNDFMLASLQSLTQAKPEQIRFCLDLPLASAGQLFSTSDPHEPAAGGAAPFFGIHQCAGAAAGKNGAAVRAPARSQASAASAAWRRRLLPGDTHIEFKAQSAQMFRVQPGRWYDSAMVSGFSDRIDPDSALANKPLFGPNGMLNVRTSQILVALGRTVTIHLEPEQLDLCAAVAGAADDAVLNIGGFCFDSEQTEIRAGGGALTFCDNTNAPYVIGVATEVFGTREQRSMPGATQFHRSPAVAGGGLK
ncbi:MAG: hypothetical protein H7Z39_12520 [Burkholderiaceae bacterium]|nr:hypothetical protein [Burkholderiaceae bacterium]